jgi:solute carrier family 25 phosphate transporter 23/24/25/41
MADPADPLSPPEDPLPQRKSAKIYSTWPSVLAGGFSSAATKTLTAPLSRMTILYQVSGSGPQNGLLANIKSVAEREGFRSLWKGNLVSVIHKVPYGSVNYYAYEYTKVRILRPYWNSDTDPGIFVRFGCGLVGGACASSLTYPLDIVRTRLATATKAGGTILGTMNDLVQGEGGLSALSRGLPATVMCQSLNLAVNFAIYESLQVQLIKLEKEFVSKYLGPEYVTNRQRGSWLSSLICGACAGTTASLIVFPLDLVRRRQQISTTPTSIMAVTKTVLAADGFKGLYRGIVPELFKVVPAVAMNFYFYELFRQVILKNVSIAPR